ncbi:hypothetical protein [Nocardioides sp. AX2bis]|uniref:hypothetical protein n=1 Tax=Nocardioides sp. AX2bis TaxID=2653157 RepID=UPI0012F2FB04|nr:hypothetical protein [Nocardioides sp. AX2bis]VXC31080.1 hypothetical protein NOCARDAX2BIS_50109 [Nocardioides sp. AX2bis]
MGDRRGRSLLRLPRLPRLSVAAAVVLGLLGGFLVAALTQEVGGTVTPDVVDEVCSAPADGGRWCAQRRQRADGLVVGAVDELWVVRRESGEDGEDGDRATVAAWPYPGDAFDARFVDGTLVVRGPDGAQAVYPPAFYALD